MPFGLLKYGLARPYPANHYFTPAAAELKKHYDVVIIGAGDHATITLTRGCGVDMRTHKLAEREIAQTSLARMNAITLHNDLTSTPCFFIRSDLSSTEYL